MLSEINQKIIFQFNSAANAVMNLLITPILEDASALCKDVYGNYIVQTIFKIDFLHYARRYIIKHHLM